MLIGNTVVTVNIDISGEFDIDPYTVFGAKIVFIKPILNNSIKNK